MNEDFRQTLPERAAPVLQGPRAQKNIHWASAWQLILSLLSILSLWGIAALMLLVVVSAAFAGNSRGSIVSLLNAVGLGFSGVLLIPSAGYALMRILGKPVTLRYPTRHANWIILLLPPLILLGHFSTQSALGKYVFLPAIHILAALIPVIWLLSLGLRGLPTGSKQRSWGVFGAGLVGAPFLSLIVEAALLIVLGIAALVYLAQIPEIWDFFLYDAANPSAPDTDAFIKLLEPYLMRPGTIYLVLLFGALLVPLIEEIFKPIGVWLLAGRGLSAAEGFAAGVFSGAGYALFENFTLSAGGGGETWAVTVAARTGTSLMHILTAGLMGWALALAWRERRYFRLMGIYLLAVLLHGLWNMMVLFTMLSELASEGFPVPDFLISWGRLAPFGLAALLGFGLFLYLMINLFLKASLKLRLPEDAPAIQQDVL